MSILARQRERRPELGYPADFIDVVRSLAPFWREGRRFTVVTNAGGLNPAGCAAAAAEVLRAAGCKKLKIGVVSGDDVLPVLRDASVCNASEKRFAHLETGAPVGTVARSLTTANAYLGAAPLVEALAAGADLVITGRVADPSLTVAPCVHRFGWSSTDWDRLAGATVAGHLIECGTQVTGGISTDWLDLPPGRDIGYPIVEVAADGSCIVTKPAGTGGRVDERVVKEQLLYEIGDAGNYLSPDCTVSFVTLRAEDLGGDRVRVSGAAGRPPPRTYKVSATYPAGYRASGTLTIVGRDAAAKARRCGEIVLRRLNEAGAAPERSLVECLGAGDATGGILRGPEGPGPTEVVLRISVADARREVVERFTREMVPLVTSGPQGTTGYFDGRPAVREVFAYWPTLIERELVKPEVEILTV
jgi:hypothetical protein